MTSSAGADSPSDRYDRSSMTTKLDKPLRREIAIGTDPWVITLTPSELKLVRKGRRKGIVLEWKAIVSGDAALAIALTASLQQVEKARPAKR